MYAFVFAAGLGTRLKPFTEHHPKALVPVGGVPMLQRVILKLKENGITNIVVNVHHFASQILEFLEQNKNFGVNIIISDETSCLLDTGGAMLHAKNLFPKNERILIHNVDILTNFDVKEMLKFHTATGADATLLTKHRNSSRQLYFDIVDHKLKGWKNLTSGESIPKDFEVTDSYESMAFGGVHIINHGVLDKIEQYATTKVFPIIPFYLSTIDSLNIHSFVPENEYQWFDIGKPETLHAAEDALKNHLL